MACITTGRRLICLVASYTGSHRYVGFLKKLRPFRYRSMTLLAGQTTRGMSLMTEINKGWQLVNTDPRNNRMRFCVCSQLLDSWIPCPQRLVTPHAEFRLGNLQRRAGGRSGMTELARHFQCPSMFFVTKRNWLHRSTQHFRNNFLCTCVPHRSGTALCWRSVRRRTLRHRRRHRRAQSWFRPESCHCQKADHTTEFLHQTFPCRICSARYSDARIDSARIVIVGFCHPPLAKLLPSTTNRFFISWL